MGLRRERAPRPSRGLSAAFVLLGLVPLAILTSSSLLMAKHAVQREASAQVQALNASFSALVANSVQDVVHVMTTAGQLPVIEQAVSDAGTNPTQATRTLQALLGARPDLDAVFITDAAGNLTAIAPSLPAQTYPNFANRDWYQGAEHSDRAYVSNSYRATVLRFGQVFSVAIRISHSVPGQAKQTVGFLVGVYKLAALQATVDTLRKSQGTAVTITDRAGTVLLSPGKNANLITSLAGERWVSQALAGHAGVATVAGPRGSVLAAYGPIPSLGWTVSVDVGQREAFADYYRMRNTVLSIAAVLAGLMLVAFLRAGRVQLRSRNAELAADLRARELAASEAQFRAAFVQAPVGMIRENMDGIILEVNVAFCEMIAMTEAEIVGRSWQSLTHPDDLDPEMDIDSLLPYATRSVAGEKRYIRPSGESVWALVSLVSLTDATGEPYILAQAVDISDRKLAEAQLNRQALHDGLTGLPNRVLVESRIEHGLSRFERDPTSNLALLFIDLDGFKDINDRLGHRVGDEVLRELSDRLQHTVRPGDTVARLGGDEFLVLCEGFSAESRAAGIEDVARIARRVLQVLSQPGGSGDRAWQVSASIGISIAGVSPNGTGPRGLHPAETTQSLQTFSSLTTSSSLVAAADAAMYHAKRHGKNRIEFYDPSMAQENSAEPHSLALVGTALEENRLRLYYQPVYELATRRIVGAEALLRMLDADGTVLPPADFLAAAEAHGHIKDFGAWSMMQACQQAVAWKKMVPTEQEFGIAVNMSVKEMEDTGFLHRVDRALTESGLPADALVIELTESAFLRDLPAGRAAMAGLRQRGVKLALDDFGTGFSSLSYLRRFAVDIIKLDRSFVADLLTDPRGALVTRGLIALAQSLQTVMVAEGVEEEQQVGALIELGAQLAQGYLLSRPLPAEQFTILLADQQQAIASLLTF